jgi:hypothetical protein
MRANAVPFTASGEVEVGNSDVVGLAFTGFSSVVVYDGTDTTGHVIIVGTAPGTYGLNYELLCSTGIYIQATGTGVGTVWVAG